MNYFGDRLLSVKSWYRPMITPVRSQTIVFIHEFQFQNGYAPSTDEMMQRFSLARSPVKERVDLLIRDGFATQQSRKSRTLQLTQKAIAYLQSIGKYQGNAGSISFQRKLPFLGEISAGFVSLPATTSEFLDFEHPNPETDFSLRVSGDSMIGAGIVNGASVIFKRVPDGYEPRPGEIVAAYVEGSGTTLKRFYRQDSIVILRAANPDYPDQKIDTCETSVQIQGVWRMTIA